ncbi:MAG: outer membrane beta-barrel protein [Geminicoccaceae bacterium]|nr:outer membrane beta-barrel protein [Geminicoccaceae bacterium]
MMTRTLAGALLASTVLLAPFAGAEAQQRPPEKKVGPYDPIGLRRGAFLIYPSADAGVAYDSNIYADDQDEEDIILTVAPAVRADSQWSRHALSVGLDAEGAAYVDHDESSYLDASVFGEGRFDVRRGSYAFGNARVGRIHEDRASPDDAGQDEVTNLFSYDANLGYRYAFNRFYVQPNVRATRLDFEDGDENFRDRNRLGAGLRLGLALSPLTRVFTEVAYDIVRYDDTTRVNRDSDGLAARVGAELELSALFSGEVAVGYTRREYDSSALDTAQGPSAEGALTYSLSELTSFTGRVSAGVEETTVAFDGDLATADVRTEISLEANHELRRNILLNGEVGYVHDDFDGTSRADDTFYAGAGAEYLLNRLFSLKGSYRYSTRSSDSNAAEYDRHLLFVGVSAHL